jgi:hypothetical protein
MQNFDGSYSIIGGFRRRNLADKFVNAAKKVNNRFIGSIQEVPLDESVFNLEEIPLGDS